MKNIQIEKENMAYLCGFSADFLKAKRQKKLWREEIIL